MKHFGMKHGIEKQQVCKDDQHRCEVHDVTCKQSNLIINWTSNEKQRLTGVNRPTAGSSVEAGEAEASRPGPQ